MNRQMFPEKSVNDNKLSIISSHYFIGFVKLQHLMNLTIMFGIWMPEIKEIRLCSNNIHAVKSLRKGH